MQAVTTKRFAAHRFGIVVLALTILAIGLLGAYAHDNLTKNGGKPSVNVTPSIAQVDRAQAIQTLRFQERGTQLPDQTGIAPLGGAAIRFPEMSLLPEATTTPHRPYPAAMRFPEVNRQPPAASPYFPSPLHLPTTRAGASY